MAWIRWNALVVGAIVLWGCSRENPEFSDDDAGKGTGTATDPVASDGATTGAGPGGDTLDGPNPLTTGEVTGDGDATGSEGTGHGDTAVLDTGQPVCAPEFGPPFELIIEPPLDGAMVPGTCDEPFTFGMTVSQIQGSGINGIVCEACPCVTGSLHSIVMDPPPGTLPLCIQIELQRASSDGAECTLEAYTFSTTEGVIRVVSNVIDPTIEEPFDFSVGVAADNECPEQCDPSPGPHALVAAAGTVVPPTGVPVVAAGGGELDVYNFGSGIDGDCNEVGRWYAIPAPG